MRYTNVGLFALAAILILPLLTAAPSPAASSREGTWTASACDGSSNPNCGGVALINAGTYTVTNSHLHHLDPQGSKYQAANGCDSTDKEFSNDLPMGNYYVFIVPADCAYQAKMNIKDGPTKDKKIFLTPGCQLELEVTGDLVSNAFKVRKVGWTDAAKAAGRSGPVVDANGFKCGLYSKSGAN